MYESTKRPEDLKTRKRDYITKQMTGDSGWHCGRDVSNYHSNAMSRDRTKDQLPTDHDGSWETGFETLFEY